MKNLIPFSSSDLMINDCFNGAISESKLNTEAFLEINNPAIVPVLYVSCAHVCDGELIVIQ